MVVGTSAGGEQFSAIHEIDYRGPILCYEKVLMSIYVGTSCACVSRFIAWSLWQSIR